MSLNTLPPEIQLMVFRHLDGDSATLSVLTFVSRSVHDCAFEILNQNCTIDVSSGETKIIHKVMAHLFDLAQNNAMAAPNVAIDTTGDFFMDKVVKHASKFKTLKICLQDRYGIDSGQVSRQVLTRYMSAIRLLESDKPYGFGSWGKKFLRGNIDDLLRFLLRVTRQLTTLEVEGSLYWIPQMGMQNMCSTLHTLKLVNITNKSLSPNCCYIVSLPTLAVLDITDMKVNGTTLKFLDPNLSVTSLRFINCWVSPGALNRAIKACRKLQTFEYSLDASRASEPVLFRPPYDMSALTSILGRHNKTLKHLTILDKEARPYTYDSCLYPYDLSELTALESLTLTHVHLHPRPAACRFSDYRGSPIHPDTPTTSILSFAPSLQKLELYACDKTLVIGTLFEVLQRMDSDDNLLPKLHTLNVEFTRGRSFLTGREKLEYQALKVKLGGCDVEFLDDLATRMGIQMRLFTPRSFSEESLELLQLGSSTA